MKKTLFCVILSIITSLITACSFTANKLDTDVDHLIIGLPSEVPTLDLHLVNTVVSRQVLLHVHETLIIQDDELGLQSGLATSWHQVDNRTWEFKLRKGVYFHNSEPFTAEDVAFTMRRAKESPNVTMVLGMIDVETIQVVNRYTIRIGTYEPFTPFLSHLAHTSAGILCGSADIYPIGTGPFQLDSHVAGDNIILTRFNGYYGKDPYIDKLTFRTIPDPSVRQIELETGGIHVDLAPQPHNFVRIEEAGQLELLTTAGLRTNYIGMNTTRGFLSDVRVRQAINYAVDMDIIFEEILNANGQQAYTYIAPSVWGHHTDIMPRPNDLKRAITLMQKARIENLSLTIVLGTDSLEASGIALTLRQQLAAIGIDLSIQVLEWPVFLETVINGEADLFFIGWTADTADADYGLYSLFHSDMFGPAGNLTFFENLCVDDLLDAARHESDYRTRLAKYHEVMEILHEEVPWILVNHPGVQLGINSNVRGIGLARTGTHDFSHVYFTD